MKKIIVSTLFTLLIFASLSQDNNIEQGNWDPAIYRVGEIYPGYIVNMKGDTVEGFLKADTRCSIAGVGSSNQNQVTFYQNQSDKKPLAKYKPDEIKAYKIADKVYQSITYSGGLLKKPNFNLVVEDGAIRIYEWYSTVENYMSITRKKDESWQDYDKRCFETKIIIAKDPKEPMEHSSLGLGFAKKNACFDF